MCLVLGAAAAVVFISAAAADNVKNETFQLDGNIAQDTTSPVTYDWANFFNSSGGKLTLPSNYTASSFVKDFNTTTDRKGNTVFDTSDASTYTIGSKDTLDVNQWSCTPANNVTDKGDIMNAYAAAYTDPVSGHKFMFFALERNANAGDANVAFWFLAGNPTCPAAGGSFTGSHSNGDLLIVSAFTNGGSVSTINAYEWQNGALNTTPVANGGDCSSTTLTADPTCATSNTAAISNIPWLTENKADGVGHKLQTGEFFEGGIDLSAPSVNLANNCFNTFIPDTRSSQSLTATLYDFAFGRLGECSSTTTTSPVDSTDHTKGPATAIPAEPGEASVTVQDKTVIAVNGIGSFNSTNAQNLTWHICGPTDATTPSTQLCDGSTSSSTPACSTLPAISCVGVAVGSTAITAAGTYYSPVVTLTEAGRYCFRADFAGDSAVSLPGSSDSSSGECFTVGPQQPSLQTQATSGPVDFGQKISDTVTLSGTADEQGTGGPAGSDGSIGTVASPVTLGGDATGDIIVKAYGPDSCSTVAFTSSAISANGDSSVGGAGTNFEFQPSAPGQYVFVASYAGDSPNTKAIPASACADAPSAEKVTVRQIPTSLITKQSWYPNDTATITSSVSGNSLGTGGTIVFTLYDTATCSGNVLYKQTVINVGGAHSVEVGTSNPGGGDTGTTSYKEVTAYTDGADSTLGPYSWKVVYTPAAADTAHLGRQSSCTPAGAGGNPPASIEKHTITYTNDNSGGTQP